MDQSLATKVDALASGDTSATEEVLSMVKDLELAYGQAGTPKTQITEELGGLVDGFRTLKSETEKALQSAIETEGASAERNYQSKRDALLTKSKTTLTEAVGAVKKTYEEMLRLADDKSKQPGSVQESLGTLGALETHAESETESAEENSMKREGELDTFIKGEAGNVLNEVKAWDQKAEDYVFSNSELERIF